MQETQTQQPDNTGSDAEAKLIAWGEKKFKEFSTGRIAEEREWYQAALFDQLKQWLTLRDGRYYPIQQNPSKPVPMPVSNYFSKTISDNANRLGAKMPDFVCQSDGSFETRRQAQYAEAALAEADVESGADILNPYVARHDALWGFGCLRDYIDTSEGGYDEVPDVDAVDNESLVCQDCGAQVEPGPMPPQCPQCGSTNVQPEQTTEPQLGEVSQFPQGKLKTTLVSPFEIYVARDCIDPNQSKTKIYRYRKGKEEARSLFGDKSKELAADNGQTAAPQYYIDSLRSLNASNVLCSWW
jgi:rubrerythrin